MAGGGAGAREAAVRWQGAWPAIKAGASIAAGKKRGEAAARGGVVPRPGAEGVGASPLLDERLARGEEEEPTLG